MNDIPFEEDTDDFILGVIMRNDERNGQEPKSFNQIKVDPRIKELTKKVLVELVERFAEYQTLPVSPNSQLNFSKAILTFLVIAVNHWDMPDTAKEGAEMAVEMEEKYPFTAELRELLEKLQSEMNESIKQGLRDFTEMLRSHGIEVDKYGTLD